MEGGEGTGAGPRSPGVTRGCPGEGGVWAGLRRWVSTGDTSRLVALAGNGGDSRGVGCWKGPPKQQLTWELLQPPEPPGSLPAGTPAARPEGLRQLVPSW